MINEHSTYNLGWHLIMLDSLDVQLVSQIDGDIFVSKSEL